MQASCISEEVIYIVTKQMFVLKRKKKKRESSPFRQVFLRNNNICMYKTSSQ